jgi:hypothetical protein
VTRRARTSERAPRSLPVALSGADAGDPPGLREQVDALFLQWAQLSEEQPAEKAHNGFVGQLQQAGFLKAGSVHVEYTNWHSFFAERMPVLIFPTFCLGAVCLPPAVRRCWSRLTHEAFCSTTVVLLTRDHASL